MSVDYSYFLENLEEIHNHLHNVYLGIESEEPKSAVSFVMTQIPHLLNSSISAAMRATLLKQYTEIQGATRDVTLATLNRNEFYEFAALTSSRESDLANKSRVAAVKDFEDLVQYLDSNTQDTINTASQEQEVLKSQMDSVIRSKTGTPSDTEIGILDVINYIRTTNKV